MIKKDDKKNKNNDIAGQDSEVLEDKQNDELEHLKQKLEVAENDYKRALADYQNLQKRAVDERRNLIMSSNRDLLLRILSVLDTLVLANKHEENENLKICIAQFEDVLKMEGVTKIETNNAEFDPHLMEAISTAEGEEGKVLEELKTGYMINGKILRPAQVKVGSTK